MTTNIGGLFLCSFPIGKRRCIFIPRPRLPERERKETVGIRLPKWMIDEVDKLGGRTEVIEKAVSKYLQDIEKKGKKY